MSTGGKSMAVVVKELNQSLINQANNNSMDGERGTAYFEYYKRLTDKIQTWPISDTKIQNNKLFTIFAGYNTINTFELC